MGIMQYYLSFCFASNNKLVCIFPWTYCCSSCKQKAQDSLHQRLQKLCSIFPCIIQRINSMHCPTSYRSTPSLIALYRKQSCVGKTPFDFFIACLNQRMIYFDFLFLKTSCQRVFTFFLISYYFYQTLDLKILLKSGIRQFCYRGYTHLRC